MLGGQPLRWGGCLLQFLSVLLWGCLAGVMRRAIELFLEKHFVVGRLGVIPSSSRQPKQDILCSHGDYVVFVCWKSKIYECVCVRACVGMGQDSFN